ncbi:alpha/beta fold hydrolase [Agromyces sp. SYSU T0242]|uniref:alpha/beta fold hydrolase n=1 Tax=Agromyces litoreus TaxID=3158561 RepID=UPI003397913B
MEIVLVPGMWLDGESWGEVAEQLEGAGHRVRSLTLPGLASRDEDRRGIGYDDHVGAIVEAIDAASGPVLLVGHSAGCDLSWAAVDRRPDRVVRAILVGGLPSADGDALVGGYDAVDGEIPLPDWSAFGEEDLRDLDDAARERFRALAIPAPAGPLAGPQRLADERRLDVPVTAVCTEYSVAQLDEWLAGGPAWASEFLAIRDVERVDLPTGHWPQFTRPRELAELILARAGAAAPAR